MNIKINLPVMMRPRVRHQTRYPTSSFNIELVIYGNKDALIIRALVKSPNAIVKAQMNQMMIVD